MNTTNDIVKNALVRASARNADMPYKEQGGVKFYKNPVRTPRFKKGDKVSTRRGQILTVSKTESVDEGWGRKNIVYFDDAIMGAEEFDVEKVRNATAKNAKFKVGDKVNLTYPPGSKDVFIVKKVDTSGKMGVGEFYDIADKDGKIVACLLPEHNLKITNAKFKVGDIVSSKSGTKYKVVVPYNPSIPGKVYTVKVSDGTPEFWDESVLKISNAAPMSAHEASVLLSSKRKAVTQYAKVEPNTLYYRALGGIFAVPESDTMKAAIAAIGSRVLPYQVGGVVGNCKA